MIKNERQLQVAHRKLTELQDARSALDGKASWQAYTDLIDDVSVDIAEYEDLREGRTRSFHIRDLDSLGQAIIKARISKGLTHSAFADLLEVSEQQVQKDERLEYERAGLARLAEILDVIGYEFIGTLRPKDGADQKLAAGASMSTSVTATPASQSAGLGGETASYSSRPSAPMSAAITEWIERSVRGINEGNPDAN